MASPVPLSGNPGHQMYTLETEYRFEAGDMTALLLFSCITFFQQVGFASLESGSVRVKNTRNVLMKTLIDKLVSGIVYWAVGFAFAYGDTAAGLIGRSFFFLGDRLGGRKDAAAAGAIAADGSPLPPLTDSQRAAAVLALWFSSWVFLITATTIVSGCLAERARFEAYLAYTPVMAGLAFPLAVHWAFHGFLSDATCSYIDFAGGSTVHLLGGAAGLAAALAVGPRLGRFHVSERRGEEEEEVDDEEEGEGDDGNDGGDEEQGNGDAVAPRGAEAGSGADGVGTRRDSAAASGSANAYSSAAAASASGIHAASPAVAVTGSNANGHGGSINQRRREQQQQQQQRRRRQRQRQRRKQQQQQAKGNNNNSSSSSSLRGKRRQPFTIPGHNVESVTLGTLMLWFGWYGFNVAPSYLRGGPTLADRTAVAVRAAVSTTLSACASGLTALLVGYFFPSKSASYPMSSASSSSVPPGSSSVHGSGSPSGPPPAPPAPPLSALPPQLSRPSSSPSPSPPSPSPSSNRTAASTTTNSKAIDLRTACNGVLGGIVAATALCAYVEPWAAVAVGAVAGVALVFSSSLLEGIGVDDPLDSVSVHGTCALVGLLGAAFLASPAHLEAYRGSSANRECGGLFYLGFGRKEGWQQLGVQVAGALAISALSFALSALVFFSMRVAGVLRVDTATEIAGIDNVDHGGPAYHF